MKVASRVVRNTTILYLKMFLTVGLTLYTTRLMREALGDSDYGIYGLIASMIAMLAFINISMAAATQRFMSYAEGAGDVEAKKRIFNVSFILHIVIAIIAGIGMELMSFFFFGGTLDVPADRILAAKLLYQFTIITTLLSIMQVPYDAVINAHENMLVYSVVGIIESVLKLGAVLLLFYLPGDRLVNYGVLIIVVTVIVLSIYRIYCHRRYRECKLNPKRYYDKGLIKSMTSFSGWTILTTGSSAVLFSGMGMVLNSFFGVLINSAVTYASQISVQVMGFSTMMVKALSPVIAKSEGAGNRLLMLKAVFTGSKAAFYLTSIVAVPILIETPFVMSLWLKGDLPVWTFAFTRLELIKNLLASYSYPLNSAIGAQGSVKWVNIARSLVLLLCVPVMILFLRAGYEPWIAYVVIISGLIVSTGILIYFSRRNCGLNVADYLRRVIAGTLTICVAVTLVSLVPHFMMQEGFWRVVVVTLVSVAAHGGLIYAFGLDAQEKELVQTIAAKAKGIFRKT